jgi:DNA-binding NtrC family response regulator
MNPTQSCGAVVVAEDHHDLRKSLAAVLSDEGYKVITAEDGHQALRAVLSADEPCLVFLDLTMPRCDGKKFLELLNDHPEPKPPVQIVLMSGLDEAEEFAERQDLIFLKKPIGIRAMLDIASQYCKS